MQSALISSHQVLANTTITENIEFYNYVRVYLKTAKGIHFKELNENNKVNKFLRTLMDHVLKEITASGKLNDVKKYYKATN